MAVHGLLRTGVGHACDARSAGRRKGRPETEPANATSGDPSDGGREIDRSRAAERGRGRQATSPRRIPWRGWKDILWRAYEKMNDNRLLAVAAGVVFYALLALFLQ